ncbi:hypothetical protein FrCorBMG51_05415, partial [Protofrankia coriariae]
MARINGSRPFPEIPTRHPKVDVPLWVVLAGLAGRMCARLVLFLIRHPVLVGLLLTVLVIRDRYGAAGLGLALLAVVG